VKNRVVITALIAFIMAGLSAHSAEDVLHGIPITTEGQPSNAPASKRQIKNVDSVTFDGHTGQWGPTTNVYVPPKAGDKVGINQAELEKLRIKSARATITIKNKIPDDPGDPETLNHLNRLKAQLRAQVLEGKMQAEDAEDQIVQWKNQLKAPHIGGSSGKNISNPPSLQ
jgi:hypothetical protein